MYSISVLGAGAYGTAIARCLTYSGHDVTLWTYKAEHGEVIRRKRENIFRLPGVRLPDNLKVTDSLFEACTNKDALIFAIPSLHFIDILKGILSFPDIIEGRPKIATVTKGFIERNGSVQLILDAMESYLPGIYKGHLAYLSGPSHAEEMGKDKLTGLISASRNWKIALWFRDLLHSRTLMMFPSLDVVGVQVSASSKNIIAIAYGILDALSEIDPVVGDNTKSLLFAAGLNEIQTIGMALGSSHPETFTSIAGVGDLDVTCHSDFARNRRFGKEIVLEGIIERFADIEDLINQIDSIGYTPEGVPASKHIYKIAMLRKLKLPVAQRIFRILNREMEPLELIDSFTN